MEFDGWIEGYKVRMFPWIDGKHYFVNVQYYRPGSSLARPPAFDKSALIVMDEAGKHVVNEFTHTMVVHIARLNIPDDKMLTIRFE